MDRQSNFRNSFFPGVIKFNSNAKIAQDLIFFFVLTALPTSFYSFIDQEYFFDYKLAFFLTGIFYFIFNIGSLKIFFKIPLSRYYIFICLFVFFKILHSFFENGITLLEITKVFRTNFHYPITTLGFLLYVIKMSKVRINRFFYWLISSNYMPYLMQLHFRNHHLELCRQSLIFLNM